MIVVDVAEADFVIENVDERDVILLTLRTRPLGDGNCDGIMSEPISGEMRSDGDCEVISELLMDCDVIMGILNGDGDCDRIEPSLSEGEMRGGGWSDRGVSEVGSHRMGGERGGESRPGVWLS